MYLASIFFYSVAWVFGLVCSIFCRVNVANFKKAHLSIFSGYASGAMFKNPRIRRRWSPAFSSTYYIVSCLTFGPVICFVWVLNKAGPDG